MTLAIHKDLAAFTVHYNGVQFGGADAEFESTPPQYRLRGSMVYDDAGLSVKYTKYTLTVVCSFHADTEAEMTGVMGTLETRLTKAGKELKLVGLGAGFINPIVDGVLGPRPVNLEMNPIGNLCWEVIWTVEFCIYGCQNTLSSNLAAFNFDATWQNDFEGITRRTISGFVEVYIRKTRNAGTNGLGATFPPHTADIARDKLTIVCPVGFRRVQNVWRENRLHNRIDFIISDEVLPGHAPPTGCTMAYGDVTYQSAGPGFQKAMVTMNMSLRTSPSVSPKAAGVIFLAAARAKQDSMTRGLGTGGVCLPQNIFIRNAKYDNARETQASMTWLLTRCVNNMMTAAGIWEPLTPNNYNQWRTSVENLWHNRGAILTDGFRIQQDPKDVLIMDLCSNVSSITIGDTPKSPNSVDQGVNFSFTCPEVPKDGGWIGHDLSVKFYREDRQTWHRKAASYEPVSGSSGQLTTGGTDENDIPLGGPSYSQSGSDDHEVEQHGYPYVYVLLQFKGLRLKHKPALPEINSIAGIKPLQIKQGQDGPKVKYDSPCPVWFLRGYRLYRLTGYVPKIKPVQSLVSCAASKVEESY